MITSSSSFTWLDEGWVSKSLDKLATLNQVGFLNTGFIMSLSHFFVRI